jgi:hypothetical protein
MSPRGGVMLGMSRTVAGDRVVEYEALRIETRDGRLVYVAQPSGQSLAEFPATSASDTAAVFANPAHDFPQRILYRRLSRDSIVARVEGVRGGVERGIDFRYARVPCPDGTSASGRDSMLRSDVAAVRFPAAQSRPGGRP